MKDRIACLLFAAAACFGVHGADVTVTSTWDADTQTWIGNVTELTNALRNAVNNQTVYLSKGMYDISSLTNAPMYSANGGGYGAALLEMPYGALNFEIVGATGNPDDVVLFANDSEYRILMMNKNPNYRSALRNVTIVGGNASEKHINAESYRRGGGVFLNGSDKTVVSNCVFRGNRADKQGGAIAAQGNVALCRVIDCKVVSNVSGGDGGGIYNIALVENCTVISNSASGYGGGIGNCTLVTNTDILYNCAQRGGGACNSALSGCASISHNVATSSSYGGGLYRGSATNCVFSDNYASAAVDASCLLKCDIIGMYTSAAIVDSCVFHGAVNNWTGIAVGNVNYPDGQSAKPDRLVDLPNDSVVRNSLFTNCVLEVINGGENYAMFQGPSSGSAIVENCTIVDNDYCFLFRAGNGSTFHPQFINCAIVGNRRGETPRDISSRQGSAYMSLTNCAYCVEKNRVDHPEAPDYGCIQVSLDDCKFVGGGDHPYSLKFRSSLLRRGLVRDWMADATDIVGNPRVRDGKVDIGCYQCWLEPTGFCIIFQ